MCYGYLRSGAPQWARGRRKDGAHLASFSLLGNPTARCGIVFLAVCRHIWLFLTLSPSRRVSYPLIILPRPELDGSILSSTDDPCRIARHVCAENGPRVTL